MSKKRVDVPQIALFVLLSLLFVGYFVFDVLTAPEGDRMSAIIGNAIGFSFVAAIVVAGIVQKRKYWEEQRSMYNLQIEHLRQNPWKLDALRGEFEKVCVLRATGHGGDDGASFTVFLSFVVTHDGETCDIEEGSDHDHIAERAQWLARTLDIPFHDSSYGG